MIESSIAESLDPENTPLGVTYPHLPPASPSHVEWLGPLVALYTNSTASSLKLTPNEAV